LWTFEDTSISNKTMPVMIQGMRQEKNSILKNAGKLMVAEIFEVDFGGTRKSGT
jgi:hypothetical protein